MSQTPEQILIQKLAQSANSRLAVGAAAKVALSDWEHLAVSDPAAVYEIEQHVDFVLVSGMLEILESTQAEQLLAHLRDRVARELVILVEGGTHWPSSEMIALGFRHIPELMAETRGYYFALETYKRVPEWLNSRFWANPENFNKYRW